MPLSKKDAPTSRGASASDAKGAAEKSKDAVGEDVAAWMSISEPPEDLLTYAEREPDKVIPDKGSDGADTPSGHALRITGAPNPDDAGSEKERLRGLRYGYEKYKKRWLS